jgi:hypothetical protein
MVAIPRLINAISAKFLLKETSLATDMKKVKIYITRIALKSIKASEKYMFPKRKKGYIKNKTVTTLAKPV